MLGSNPIKFIQSHIWSIKMKNLKKIDHRQMVKEIATASYEALPVTKLVSGDDFSFVIVDNDTVFYCTDKKPTYSMLVELRQIGQVKQFDNENLNDYEF